MKILVYTVSDFKNNALDCIKLMLSSFTNRNFDFKIITNNTKFVSEKNIIHDDTLYNYVGFLKYSKCIPEGYDKYIYLDSDILFFDSVEALFSEKKFSGVREPLPILNEWFLYKKADVDYINKAKNLNGFNAGTFSYENISFLEKIRKCFEPYITYNVGQNAVLEQSSFNYILTKEINFDLKNVHDLTDITQLFAGSKPQEDMKRLYHFCGFTNEMESKFLKMKKFYDNYKR